MWCGMNGKGGRDGGSGVLFILRVVGGSGPSRYFIKDLPASAGSASSTAIPFHLHRGQECQKWRCPASGGPVGLGAALRGVVWRWAVQRGAPREEGESAGSGRTEDLTSVLPRARPAATDIDVYILVKPLTLKTQCCARG